MRTIFGMNGWKIFAAVVITALCAIGGAIGGFFLGGVGSIPGVTLGTLLGIEISTTLLGATFVPPAIVGGLCTLGIFKSNAYHNQQTMKQCSQELEANAEKVLTHTPMLQA